MGKISLEQLGPLLKERRGGRGIREVATEIGISAATLSRVECGKQPDLDTFSKICQWLQVDAGEVLGCSLPGASAGASSPIATAAHFRAEKTMSTETVAHLSKLILYVQQAVADEHSSQQ